MTSARKLWPMLTATHRYDKSISSRPLRLRGLGASRYHLFNAMNS